MCYGQSELNQEDFNNLQKTAYDYAVYCYHKNGDNNILEDYNRMLKSLQKLQQFMIKKGVLP